MERNAHHGAGYDESLGEVGLVDEVVVESCGVHARLLERYGGVFPSVPVAEDGAYTEHVEEVFRHGVALQRTVHQSVQFHFRLPVVGEGGYFIPV